MFDVLTDLKTREIMNNQPFEIIDGDALELPNNGCGNGGCTGWRDPGIDHLTSSTYKSHNRTHRQTAV